MDYRVEKAIALIRGGARQRLSVAGLARDVGLSPSRFQHLFKHETGRSPAQYLHHFRMEQARVLLETTALTIEQIVLQLGLSDRSHFERGFKKAHGRTPTQHRAATRRESALPLANSAMS